MNLMKYLVASAAVVLAAFAGTHVHADESGSRGSPGINNTDFIGWVGMAAEPSAHTAAFRGGSDNSSSYNCANTAAGGSRLIRYPFTLPDLREFEFVRIWGQKLASTADLDMRLKRSCTVFLDPDAPVVTTLGTTSLAGAPGYFSSLISVPGTEVPDNALCRYWLEVEFGSTAQACAPNTQSLRIMKVRLQSTVGDRIFRSAFRAAP